MKYEQYEFLRIRVERGVAFVSIHHPPMNLLDLALLKELGRLLDDVQDDEAIRVLVFESADPDFFLAHYDMQELLTRPVITEKTKALKPFYQLLERYRTLPQVTIARLLKRRVAKEPPCLFRPFSPT
jgi:enoyl-CoA hydratase/carnithine racemase